MDQVIQGESSRENWLDSLQEAMQENIGAQMGTAEAFK